MDGDMTRKFDLECAMNKALVEMDHASEMLDALCACRGEVRLEDDAISGYLTLSIDRAYAVLAKAALNFAEAYHAYENCPDEG